MLEGLDDIAGGNYAQPMSPETVPTQPRRLASATTGEQIRVAYSCVLYAFGNNHAGTYYPVVLPAIPFLGELLRDGTAVVRECVLDILIDLSGTFWPEPGFAMIRDSDGVERSLRHALHEAVGTLRADIQGGRVDPARSFALVTELLPHVDEPPPESPMY
jgi:hypothetical protein